MSGKKKRKKLGNGAVTLQHIADHCGVSRITVSYALRGKREFVSQATIDRVRAAAREMGYDPSLSHAARRLRYQQHGTRVVNQLVALFFPSAGLDLRYWSLAYKGLRGGLLDQDFAMLSCSADPIRGSIPDQLPPIFRRGDVDGAIIFPTEQYRDNLVDDLRQAPGFDDRPIVTVIEPLKDCSAVLVDDVQIGELAAGHLLDLGHRHLLCFQSSRYSSPVTTARLAGHRQAFTRRGLDPQEGLHVAEWIWDDQIQLTPAAREFLEKYPYVTGILCPNDGVGIPLARSLQFLGYRIPEDISIIGADDCEEWLDQNGHNIWSSVQVPLLELGRQAASLVIQRIKGQKPNGVSVTLPVSLVERATTAPPPISRVSASEVDKPWL